MAGNRHPLVDELVISMVVFVASTACLIFLALGIINVTRAGQELSNEQVIENLAPSGEVYYLEDQS